MMDERFDDLRLLEALLFASAEPLAEASLAARFPEGTDLPGLLGELAGMYGPRGVNLVHFDGKWCFRTAPDLGPRMRIEAKVTRKMSRSALETLAVIAYHQPVTRAEIEAIRGVGLSKGTLDTLLEIGWVRPKGRRRTPGRPVIWATTDGFLEHFGLESLEALPGLEEMKAAGLLDLPSMPLLGAQALPGEPLPSGDEGDDAAAAEPADGAPEALDEAALLQSFPDLADEP
jgi:segregation and condensation protein B